MAALDSICCVCASYWLPKSGASIQSMQPYDTFIKCDEEPKTGDFTPFLVDFWPKTGENWAVLRGVLCGNIACKIFI
jgi:hypothetical protein